MNNRRLFPFLFFIAAFLLFAFPAYANEPIFQGVFGSSPVLFMSGWTMGFAFMLVIALEAFVYVRIASLNWSQAIISSFVLNLISSIAGAFLGALGFSTGEMSLIFLIVAIAAWTSLAKWGSPNWLIYITVVCIIGGVIGSIYSFGMSVPPKPPPIAVMILLAPLPLGFGLTLVFEGWQAKSFLRTENPWPALFKANVASYLLLAILVLFFGPNPYSSTHRLHYYMKLASLASDGASAQDMLTVLEHRHASKLLLLGLSKSNPPPENYSAAFEIDALAHGFSYSMTLGNFHNPNVDPSPGIQVVDSLLAYPSLNPESVSQLNSMRQAFICWLLAKQAIAEHDQNKLNQAYADWDALKLDTIGALEPLAPRLIIDRIANFASSGLTLPEEETE